VVTIETTTMTEMTTATEISGMVKTRPYPAHPTTIETSSGAEHRDT
jgi:hypothetical protein